MTMRSAWSRTWKALTLAGAVLGAACGGIVDGTGETGYRNIDASGGEVRAKDTLITVPEGAVDAAVTITIAPAPADQLPEGAAGKAVDMGPENAEFLQPVTVQLAFDATALPDPTRPDLTWVGAVVDGEWEPLLDPVIDEAASTVRGTTLRSGRFGVVHGCGRGRRCPVALAFDSPPQRVEAGACSGATVLKTIDAAGRRSPVQHDTAVALSSDEPSVRFYGDAQCQQELSSLTIPARQTDATFYFRGLAARSVALAVQARDLQPASQDEVVQDPAPAALKFYSLPQTVAVGACSGPTTVGLVDASGNRTVAAASTPVAFQTSAGMALYSDSACTVQVTASTIAAGSGSTTVSFKAFNVGTYTITASSPGLTSDSQAETVQNPQPGPPAALKFTSAPQTVVAGACSGPTRVGLVDASGNNTVAATSTPVAFQTAAGMALYIDVTCSVPVNTATIAAGSSSTTVYFTAYPAGTYTITASSAGLTSASQDETAR